jgi:drug/metabolite transporter (DMT)-like permease
MEENSESNVDKNRRSQARPGDLVVGVFLVLGGASCYGLLATFVRLSYGQGFAPAEVLLSQFAIGVLTLGMVALSVPAARASMRDAASRPRPLMMLILGGSSIGLTGSFYYLSVAYTSVSVSVVLLMQSVWMSIAVDAISSRERPTLAALYAVFLVLVGTVMATGIFGSHTRINPRGLAFGVLAALSYAVVICISKHQSTTLHPATRSFYMMIGGAIAVIVVAAPQLNGDFHWSVFWSWGWIAALFGAILPTFLFAKGVPLIGVSLAAILSSAELPVAIVTASAILAEHFNLMQWCGVVVIVAAVVLANVRLPRVVDLTSSTDHRSKL